MAERTIDDILDEISEYNGKNDKATHEKWLEVADISKKTGDTEFHVIGLMNAAMLACKTGDINLCMELMAAAEAVDEKIWAKYMEKPHMQKLLQVLGNAGVLN